MLIKIIYNFFKFYCFFSFLFLFISLFFQERLYFYVSYGNFLASIYALETSKKKLITSLEQTLLDNLV